MFKKPSIRFRIPRLTKKLAHIRNSVRFRDAKNIGIIYCSDNLEKHHAIKDFVAELQVLGKEVTVLTFLEKGMDNHEFLFNYFTKKDFGTWGGIENPNVKSFVELPLDFLLCFDIKTNLYLKYILSMSQAKCRIGMLEEESGAFFELMVKPDSNNIRSVVQTIRRYTLSIN